MKTNDRSLNGDDSGTRRGVLEQQYRADFDADECIRAALDAVDDHSDREEIAAEAYRVAARKWRQLAIGEGLAPLGGLTEAPRIEAELRPDGRRIDVVGTVLDWRGADGPWRGVGHLDSGSVWAAPVGSVPPEGPLRPLSVPLAVERRRVSITATLEPCGTCRAALIVVNGVARGRVVFGGTVERPTVTAHRDDCPADRVDG